MIKEAIEKLVNKQDLTFDEAKEVMNEIMSGETPDILISAYLVALRMKGETIEEISGSARGMRDNGTKLLHDMDVIEIVGTGGDKANTFNISTTSAFVVAAAGLPVAKHGNRSISSKSGAGDVLEALGVNISADPDVVSRCVETVGIGFMFAPHFNPAMKYVGKVRKELGFRTVFNTLGPLSNPSRAKAMVVGVYDKNLTETIANAMMNMGVERALVVSGNDNMDEITLTGATTISEIKDNTVNTYTVTPEQFGFETVELKELQGGDGKVNAQITKDILSGKEKGAKRNIVLLNAGATLYAGGMCSSIEEGIKLAEKTIDSGKAASIIDALVEASN